MYTIWVWLLSAKTTTQKYHQFTLSDKSPNPCVCVCVNEKANHTHAIGKTKQNGWLLTTFHSLYAALQFLLSAANECVSANPNVQTINRKSTFVICRSAVLAAFGIFENCFWISCVPFPVSVMWSHSVRWHYFSCTKLKREIDTERRRRRKNGRRKKMWTTSMCYVLCVVANNLHPVQRFVVLRFLREIATVSGDAFDCSSTFCSPMPPFANLSPFAVPANASLYWPTMVAVCLVDHNEQYSPHVNHHSVADVSQNQWCATQHWNHFMDYLVAYNLQNTRVCNGIVLFEWAKTNEIFKWRAYIPHVTFFRWKVFVYHRSR